MKARPLLAKQVSDPEVQALAAIAATLRADYVKEGEDDPWAGSPFAWIKTRPSRQVGKIGEQLVSGWCAAKGLDVTRCVGSQADRVISGQRAEIKFSTLWAQGQFKFQQIRNQDYSICICLGLAPFDAYMWVIPKALLLASPKPEGVIPQHGGGAGKDTHWLSFDASRPYAWMKPYGGSLKEAFSVLRRL